MAKREALGKPGTKPQADLLEIYYPKGDFSTAEWYDTRDRMYHQLDALVPFALIRGMLCERQHEEVLWSDSAEEVSSSPHVAVHVRRTAQADGEGRNPNIIRYGVEQWPPTDWPSTVGEAVAYYLSKELNRTRKLASARRRKNLPKITIAWVANNLLEECREKPPGIYLKELIRKLLDADLRKAHQSKQYTARSQAVWIVAQAGHLESALIARELSVNRSSVSRWRADDSFNSQVSSTRRFIARLKEADKWLDGPSGGPQLLPKNK